MFTGKVIVLCAGTNLLNCYVFKKKNMEDKAINLSLSFHLYLSTWPVPYYASYWWSGGGGTTRGFKLNITALLAMIPTWQFGKAISLSVNLPRNFIFWQRLIKLEMIPTWRRKHYIATCVFSNLWETVYKSCYIYSTTCIFSNLWEILYKSSCF